MKCQERHSGCHALKPWPLATAAHFSQCHVLCLNMAFGVCLFAKFQAKWNLKFYIGTLWTNTVTFTTSATFKADNAGWCAALNAARVLASTNL